MLLCFLLEITLTSQIFFAHFRSHTSRQISASTNDNKRARAVEQFSSGVVFIIDFVFIINLYFSNVSSCL